MGDLLWEFLEVSGNWIEVGIAMGVTIAGLMNGFRSKLLLFVSGGGDIILGFNRDLPVITDFVNCTPVWFYIHGVWCKTLLWMWMKLW